MTGGRAGPSSTQSAPGGYHESTCNGVRRNDLLTDLLGARADRLLTGDVCPSGAKSCTAAAAIQPFRGVENAFDTGFSAGLRRRSMKPDRRTLTTDSGDTVPDDVAFDLDARCLEVSVEIGPIREMGTDSGGDRSDDRSLLDTTSHSTMPSIRASGPRTSSPEPRRLPRTAPSTRVSPCSATWPSKDPPAGISATARSSTDFFFSPGGRSDESAGRESELGQISDSLTNDLRGAKHQFVRGPRD